MKSAVKSAQAVATGCGTRCRSLVDSAKRLFIGVHEDIGLGVGIADEIVQATTIVGESVELLDGDATFVFDHALETTVDVASADDDAAAELVLGADDELIGVFHAGARLEGLAAGDAGIDALSDTAGRVVQQMRGVGNEEATIVGRTVGVSDNAGSARGSACRASGGGRSRCPESAQHVVFVAQSAESGVERENEGVAPEIGVDLVFAIAPGVDNEAYARRPHVVEGSASEVADQALLLPAEANA